MRAHNFRPQISGKPLGKQDISFVPSPTGYDVRIAESVFLPPGNFALASIGEHMTMPADLIGFVHDKSTWARLGLAVRDRARLERLPHGRAYQPRRPRG